MLGWALAALAVAGVALGSAVAVGLRAMSCAADFSEDTIIAPASWAGTALCTRSGDLGSADREWWVLVLAAGLLVAAVAARLLRAPRGLGRGLLVGAVVAPLLVALAAFVLPSGCTVDQWHEHGASGCETNEEERPGLNDRS